MSKQEKKDHTQVLLKDTVKRLFFVQGRFDATTQEIADEAGVNRTLINYYFRSRDNLIQIVFDEAQLEEKKKSEIIMRADLSLREKISNFIENSLATNLQYPYLETYIVSQLNKGFCSSKEIPEDHLKDLYTEIEAEIEKGSIDPIAPVHFVLNLVSLLMFPTAMRPLLMQNLKLDPKEFARIISERKGIIMNILFKK